jgi:hypothetical protein
MIDPAFAGISHSLIVEETLMEMVKETSSIPAASHNHVFCIFLSRIFLQLCNLKMLSPTNGFAGSLIIEQKRLEKIWQ